MASILTYASALLLLSGYLVEASPTHFGKRTFSITQTPVKRNVSVPEHGPYRRKNIRRRNNRDDENTTAVAISFNDDMEYLLPVKIGETTYNLQLDTGSSDFWVYSEDYKAAGKHLRYKPSKHGKKVPHSSWEILYADQSGAYGEVWTDTVSIGDVSFDKQGVEVATYATDDLISDTESDGIMGFGFGSANQASPKQKTFFENIVDQLDEPLFTATLKHNSPGTYDFGFVDKTKYTGDLTYVDVQPQHGYWGFTIDEFSIANVTISKNLSAMADTGTSLMNLEDSAAKGYFKDVNGVKEYGGFYTVNCDTELPDLVFKINGHRAVIPGNSHMGTGHGDNQCYTSVQGGGSENIIGDVFFKTQFVVFKLNDGEKNAQIGFATQAA
ncbi:Type I transmembrane sorting receptor [Ascosphaera pollenicola]|nr:Type I transmembrane sorting receptor [Ascosphaera pollenicola]